MTQVSLWNISDTLGVLSSSTLEFKERIMEMDELDTYIDNCGGVQPPHLAFYREAIRFNAEAAINAFEYVHRFIEMTNETKGHYEMTGELTLNVLDNIQNMLTHAAALSRFFLAFKVR